MKLDPIGSIVAGLAGGLDELFTSDEEIGLIGANNIEFELQVYIVQNFLHHLK